MNWFGRTTTAYAGILLGGAAMGALLLSPQFSQLADADPIKIQTPRGAPVSFADLIDSVSPAVVSVNVRGEKAVGDAARDQLLERFRGVPGLEEFLEERRREEEENGPETRETRALGSGFFISADGLAVTNNHVIDGATEIQLVMSDGSEFDAELIGTDPETDLAVVKVINSNKKFPYVEFEQTDKVRVGDWVVALGNPFGLGGTATAGIVSADGRDLGNGSPYTNFLQIDASINQGNSGGPTFDLHGRVIGVNTQILSPTGGSVGIGFAIPAELAVRITDSLIENGEVKRGWLGVSIGDFNEDFAEALDVEGGTGALVADVTKGSPAADAGIKRSDVIVQLNGRDIEDSSHLTRLVAELIVDSENDFVVLRRGERRVIKVKVGERPKNLRAGQTAPSDDAPEEDETTEEGTSILGVSVNELDEDQRKTLGLGDDEKGLIVVDVERDSPFARAVAKDFAILEVNGQSMESVNDLEQAIEAARSSGKEQVLVTVRSVRGTNFATVKISEDDEN